MNPTNLVPEAELGGSGFFIRFEFDLLYANSLTDYVIGLRLVAGENTAPTACVAGTVSGFHCNVS